MRILCGVLTAFMSFMVLFSVFGVGFVFTGLYGGSALVLLWLAGGQPSSFTTTSTGELATRERRLGRGMRIGAGVLGVPLGIHTALLGVSFALSVLTDVHSVKSGSSDLSDAIESIVFVSVWWVLQALSVWVLLRFAFKGRPLPPMRRALAAHNPSPPAPLAGNEANSENGPVAIES
jgi:hypothetical protein